MGKSSNSNFLHYKDEKKAAAATNTDFGQTKQHRAKKDIKKVYGELSESDISGLKAHFRHELFKKLKFVTDKETKYKSKQMEDCYKVINCKNEDMKADKQKGIVKLMEHCIMSKRNYITGHLESKIVGEYLIGVSIFIMIHLLTFFVAELMEKDQMIDITLMDKF